MVFDRIGALLAFAGRFAVLLDFAGDSLLILNREWARGAQPSIVCCLLAFGLYMFCLTALHHQTRSWHYHEGFLQSRCAYDKPAFRCFLLFCNPYSLYNCIGSCMMDCA